MTDNEIIQALECCYTTGTSCEECPMYNFDECNDVLMAKYVRDLINRQQAEIERLTINMNAFGLGMRREAERANNARAEAIQEFAERLKEKQYLDGVYVVDVKDIDNLVKEMVGDSDD